MIQLTERHLGEEVVDHMIVRHVVEEETALPSKNISIDSTSGTTLVGPLLASVVGKHGVGMVEIRDHDEPVGHLKPGQTIVLEDFGATPLAARFQDAEDHDSDADIGHDYRVTLAFGEENGVRCVTVNILTGFASMHNAHDRSGWSIWGNASGQRHCKAGRRGKPTAVDE